MEFILTKLKLVIVGNEAASFCFFYKIPDSIQRVLSQFKDTTGAPDFREIDKQTNK